MRVMLKSCTGEETLPLSQLALNLEYCGPLINAREVWHWDVAPIEDENGVIHLFLKWHNTTTTHSHVTIRNK